MYSCTSTPKHVIVTERIMHSFANKVKQDTGLELFGSGGQLINDIEMISITFGGGMFLDISQVRYLMVSFVEQFLDMINNDSEAKTYMHNYPFTKDNLSFHLSFRCPPKSFARPPYIAYAMLCKGNISYDIFNIENSELTEVLSEPYEEAFRIYQNRVKPL